jgi:hypothetical protein
MDADARRRVVSALTRLAGSDDYVDRADAGRCLAWFADLPEAQGPLGSLVLDARDTFVTRVAAGELFRRLDEIGCRLLASAAAAADNNHIDWIVDGVNDVLLGLPPSSLDSVAGICVSLACEPGDDVRRGAVLLSEVVTGFRRRTSL